jgi:hypothetical protein
MLSMVGEFQRPLPAREVVLIGLLAAIAVLVRTLWQITTHVETVAHEGAHVLAGILTGRRVLSVRIETSGGGSTDMVPKSGTGYGVAAFVGYIGASIGGLIASGLISTGRMVAVLWLGLGLCGVMLLTVRNFFGGIVVLTCGVLLYLVVRYGTAGVDTAVAYGVTWFLLISGTRVAFEIVGRPGQVVDAGVLAGMTFLWRWVWCLLWLAGTIAALVVGGAILTDALSTGSAQPSTTGLSPPRPGRIKRNPAAHRARQRPSQPSRRLPAGCATARCSRSACLGPASAGSWRSPRGRAPADGSRPVWSSSWCGGHGTG